MRPTKMQHARSEGEHRVASDGHWLARSGAHAWLSLELAPQAAHAASGESLAPRHTTCRITEDRTMTRVVKEERP
jgi:hypothetical protein